MYLIFFISLIFFICSSGLQSNYLEEEVLMGKISSIESLYKSVELNLKLDILSDDKKGSKENSTNKNTDVNDKDANYESISGNFTFNNEGAEKALEYFIEYLTESVNLLEIIANKRLLQINLSRISQILEKSDSIEIRIFVHLVSFNEETKLKYETIKSNYKEIKKKFIELFSKNENIITLKDDMINLGL